MGLGYDLECDLYLLRQWPWIHRAYYTILYLLDPFGYWPFDLYPLLSGRAPALQAPGIAKASRDLAAALAAVEVLWPVSSLRPFPVGGTQPSRDDLRHGEHVRQSLKRAI